MNSNTQQKLPENVPADILQAAYEASSSLLPVKSKERYEKTYEQFYKWRSTKNVIGADETIILAFFNEKVKTLKASSLWSKYSILKSTLQINENVDISKYNKLLAFLKRQNDSYEPKKSKILSMDNVQQFLNKAPDNNYLLMKVVVIFGLNGACRRAELCNLKINDIQDNGSILVVTLNDTKTKKKRIFTVSDGLNGYELYKKYRRLRPANVNNDRFFLYYKNNKCKSQPVGINTFAKMPQKIAEYLDLPDVASYTGHCLRRTSATFLADSGTDVHMLKRHGGWRSSSVAEGYVEESIENKVQISKRIFQQARKESTSQVQLEAQSSSSIAPTTSYVSHKKDDLRVEIGTASSHSTTAHVVEKNMFQNMETSGSIIFSNLHNCTFNFCSHGQNK